MKQKVFYFLSALCLAGAFASCSEEETYVPQPPVASIESLEGTLSVAQEDTLHFKANVSSILDSEFHWSLNGEEVSTDSVYAFIPTEMGKYQVSLTASNVDGEFTDTKEVEVYGKYKYGTFILNEGAVLMGAKGGSLTFISPKGVVTNKAFQLENNGAWLGSVPQDLFIRNNKMYIVSQNGGNEGGFLTVVNAETLKLEAAYQDELNGKVSWPTHVAVLGDDDIYMRDNSGISVFHPSTGEATFIKGTEGARKNTMAVADGKIFASSRKNVLVIEQGNDSISATITFSNNVSGVIKSSDGNIWVSTADGSISKVCPKSYAIFQTNKLQFPDGASSSVLAASFAAAPSITAKGDTLYMSGLQSKIYRHVFSTNTTNFMVDAKNMVENVGIIYNTCAVHPVTGEVVLNSIQGYGAGVAVNNISFFAFTDEGPVVSANYENYTEYPAGTFFTYNFE